MREARAGWERFQMMTRCGVPHAIEIATELVRHDLCSPLRSKDSSQPMDVQFYGVVHRAYRLGVLPKVMRILKLLKDCSCWSFVRDSQDFQLWIVERCSLEKETVPFESEDQTIAKLIAASEHFKNIEDQSRIQLK